MKFTCKTGNHSAQEIQGIKKREYRFKIKRELVKTNSLERIFRIKEKQDEVIYLAHSIYSLPV